VNRKEERVNRKEGIREKGQRSEIRRLEGQKVGGLRLEAG